MISFLLRLWLVGCSLLTLSAHAMTSQDTSAEEVRKLLIVWSDSLTSFSGQYVLKDENFRNSEVPPITNNRIVFRWRGNDMLLEATSDISSIIPFGYATLNRKHSFSSADQEGHVAGSTNLSGDWQLPLGAYLLPTELFGMRKGVPLRDRLKTGECAIFDDGGMILFCHRDSNLRLAEKQLDVVLDSELNIVNLNWVTWYRLDQKGLDLLGGTDRLRTTVIGSSFELGSFVEISGVKFPTWALRRDFVYDKGALEAADKTPYPDTLRESIIRHLQPGMREEARRITFALDMEHFSINVPLSDDDFRLKFPANANVADHSDDMFAKLKEIVVQARFWMSQSRITPLRTVFAISFLGLLISVVLLRRRHTTSCDVGSLGPKN